MIRIEDDRKTLPVATSDPVTIDVPVEPGERWWGGAVEDAHRMPLGDTAYTRDLGVPLTTPQPGTPNRTSSQSAPILLSTHGRALASHRPFSFAFAEGRLTAEGDGLEFIEGQRDLRGAYTAVAERYFPRRGMTPARELFTAPQYNTWIEQPYTPTQESVLSYARGILDAGMQPGVLFIDDNWAPDYGTWRFDPARFPDARAMVAQLHEWGFSVMLWLVPFVSPDSASFRHLEKHGLLVRDSAGQSALRRWWNGVSALLDLSHPSAMAWLTDQLDALRNEVGVDGFKFDGGDIRDFHDTDLTHGGLAPTELCEAWARLGLRYPFNEFRACWKMSGEPLAQRLQDKSPSWGADGIGALVPEMLVQGMIGHPYVCPDMIGGGEITTMSAAEGIDQEFFVRYAQVAALAPMAQFSVAPARVLDGVHLSAVEEALRIREEFLPHIMRLVDQASTSGAPVMAPMAFYAPEHASVTDQFFLGPDLFVAPIVEKGASLRRVALPSGTWRADNGDILTGPAHVDVSCEIDRLPHFARVAEGASR